MKNKLVTLSVVGAVALAVIMSVGGSLVETNMKGQYQIKQAFITGKMSARMKPGTYLQNLGTIDTWNKAETVFYTKDPDGDGDVNDDCSIEVRFADGSTAGISMTSRVNLPTTEGDAINLIEKHGYANFNEVEQRLIKPTFRQVLRHTANMMTAAESYKDKRADFINYAKDQIRDGIYQTEDEEREVVDIISGEKVKRIFKVIKRDENGNPLHEDNPMAETYIVLKNFEIKRFHYDPRVQEQIIKQQDALMAVQTAKARSAKAQQDKLTIAEEGKAQVEKIKYEQKKITEQQTEKADREKLVAETNALREKEVAETKARALRAVAELDKQTAALEKDAEILRAEGKAKAKKMILLADGALKQKLDALVEMNKATAYAFANRKVPSYYIAGGTGSKSGSNLDAQTAQFLTTQNMAMTKMLGLDMTIKK